LTSGNTGTLTATLGNILVKDVTTLDFADALSATAQTNLTVQNVDSLTSGNTGTLTATLGNILVEDVTTLDFADALSVIAGIDLTVQNVNSLTSGSTGTLTATLGNILVENITILDFADALSVIAQTNLTVQNVNSLTSGNTGTLTATLGNILVKDVTTLDFADALSVIAQTNLTVQNVNSLTSGDTGTLTATSGNILVNDVTTLDFADALSVIAGIDLTVQNVNSLLSGGTGTLIARSGNILVKDVTELTFKKTLIAKANNNLTFTDSVLAVKDKATLEATNGNVSLTKVNATITDDWQTTAGTNIVLKNIDTTVGGNAILNATAGNLMAVDSVLKTGTFAHATAGTDITLTNSSIDVKGQTADGNGNALELQAGNDILLGGAITVADKNVRITATNGAIIDKNDTVSGGSAKQIDNLTAANSHIVLSAKNGIGSTDVLEFLSAKLIDANVTGSGNIVLDITSDTILQNVTTTNGNIDIHSGGSLTIADNGTIIAAGTDKKIIFGAEKSLYFGKKSSLNAEKDIMIIAADGDIISLAVNDNEAVSFSVNDVTEDVLRGIYLVADNDLTGYSKVYDNTLIGNKADDFGKFIGSFKGRVDVIAGGSISVHNINNAAFLLGNVITGKDTLLTTVNDEMGIERIVAKQIDLVSNNIGIKQLADAVHINLDKFTASEYNTANKQLLTTEITVKLEGEIFLSVNKENATLNLEEQSISDKNIFAIKVDNLVIDHLIAGKDCGLSQIGFAADTKGGSDYKEIANTTAIKQITSDGDFTMTKLYSDNVSIHSDKITENLNILDGQFGNTIANARLEINQVETEIDAINKSKTIPNDFWVWSLDGSYSITSSHDGISYQDESLRALRRTQMYLELNGNASYTDTAFGVNINDWTHRIESRIDNINISNGSGININGLGLPLPFNRENQENQEIMNNLLKEIENIWSFNRTDNNRNTERWIVSSLEDAQDSDITDKE
jgi:hypothetical protein